jgi:hypothetical protein
MNKPNDQDTMGKLFKANFYEVFNAATGINGYKPQNPRDIETKALRFPRIDSQSEPVFTNMDNPQPQNQNSQNTVGNSSGINKSISIFFDSNNYREKGYSVWFRRDTDPLCHVQEGPPGRARNRNRRQQDLRKNVTDLKKLVKGKYSTFYVRIFTGDEKIVWPVHLHGITCALCQRNLGFYWPESRIFLVGSDKGQMHQVTPRGKHFFWV